MYSLNSEALMLVGIVTGFMAGFMFLFSGRDTLAGLLNVFDLRLPWRALRRLDGGQQLLLLINAVIASAFLVFVAIHGGIIAVASFSLIALHIIVIVSLLSYFFRDAFGSYPELRKKPPTLNADLRKLADYERFNSETSSIK